MADCIFCKVVSGEIPSDLVHEGEQVIAFRDINPQAPTHVLVIPKTEIASLDDIGVDDQLILGHMLLVIRKLAEQLRLTGGYRVVVNCGADAGQTVPHLHLHLLGGRELKWPPG